MEQKQGNSLSQEVGNMLFTLQNMTCFAKFCACKVKDLDEAQRTRFAVLSANLWSIFQDVNEIYLKQSEFERLSIDPKNREEVSNND